jgi:hypothetical protein
VIALDPYQDLYRKESSWKSIGIEARGGIRQLRRVYRNTREIERFARSIIGEKNPGGPQMEIFQDDPTCSGPAPEIIQFESQDKLEDYLIQDIREQLHLYEGKEAPIRLLKKLETAGIPTG